MHAVIPYVIAALLFGLGVYGVLRRRNAILVLMAVELMLNAVNLILVAADVSLQSAADPAAASAGGYRGGAFALFVIVLAAAEVGVGLAIVLQYYRTRRAVHLDEIELGPEHPDAVEPGHDDPATAGLGHEKETA
ncbi:NADH-quinone oxidoreductase subunit NuoK [Actinoplanes sp. N902-109]|uniref:NADH-quinone oxidoreductase subunit NuoK n=1 Tax=Actinoplanes sp. (strain N902-109) TaxID=649831 RepID=UPI00032951CD|nr:NADH-quinone oxidoreductase subunit NuoK [Actinoplanes sp. N902-109]AGL14393.1 NADH-ubiquinone oxidoreductase chain 4l [Actinoplanes sp. N902-109]